MNYSNMIEEKGLKKGFIIATLISTVIGTFTTAMTLQDRISEKRNKAKQKNLDEGQDKEIKQLREEIKKHHSGDDQQESRSVTRSKSRNGRRRRRSMDYDEDDEDFARSAQRSKRMIQQEYDENFMRMGQRYAQGDVITQNKLQAQIITLQQTVIDVLQDALMNGRSLSRGDVHRLIAAQDVARDGSLSALRGQYDRLLPELQANPRLRIEAAPVNAPIQRQLTLPTQYEDVYAPPRRVQSIAVPPSAEQLFCRYSIDLQSTLNGLSPNFSPTGTHRCPVCDVRIPVSTQDVWAFEVRTPLRDAVELREYEMDARLVVKSHTPYGDFACILCAYERDTDCILRSTDGLIEHLGRVHTSEEFERERDMHRI
ncbi:hypothetical protein LTR37_007694 [Vermiconidia calcicola]|uniref:Uncharacterized protein n=1 Tax=Vermiconidia calcicola TaxID=1690605 RepID=A0ACC3ND71_9PEZI|nr:hypothetical protein LTR37_007694 [Vermiconidia calcicola]